MEVKDIINDAIRYPLSDIKKFLMIGLPYLLLAIVSIFFETKVELLDSMTPEQMITSPEVVTSIGISFIAFGLLTLIVSIFIYGIALSVIRNTLNNSNELPKIDFVKNILDGIKTFITSTIYLIIPALIYILLTSIISFELGENALVPILILTCLVVIFLIYLDILLVVALCKLAETNSIRESINFSNIRSIAKEITYSKIFLVLIICRIISLVLSMIGVLVNQIPIIGTIITMFLFDTFLILVSYRSYGLLYKERKHNTTNIYQRLNSQENIHDTEIENIQNNIQINNSNVSADIKKCSKCGYSNPDFVNICINCGEDLD